MAALHRHAPDNDSPLALFMANFRKMKPEHYTPIVIAWQRLVDGRVPEPTQLKKTYCALPCLPTRRRRTKTAPESTDDVIANVWFTETQPCLLDMMTTLNPTSEDAHALLDMHAILDEACREKDKTTLNDAGSAIVVFLLSCNMV